MVKNRKLINNKTELYIRILMIISIIFLLAVSFYYAFFFFIIEESNYFLVHFASMIMMVLVGVISILMVQLNKTRISGDNKDDKIMIVVGVLLIISGLLSLIISYISV